MFVKIIYWKVEKDENEVVTKRDLEIEHVYDCNHTSLSPSRPSRDVDVKEMSLVLELNKDGPEGWDRTITFPVKSNTQVVDIYLMNSHGKTIQRYVY